MRSPIVLLLLAVSLPLDGATIRGVILQNELGGPPVANVQVSAVEGANPVSSLSNGTFVLQFPDKQPGETVQLIVQKAGMVVVNEFQLWVTLPKEAKAAPLTLLQCKAAEREEMASRFYRIKSFDAIERSYRKKLDELEAKSQATEAVREQLRVERDQAREAAQRASEQLAKVRVSEASELYRQGMSLFGEGKVDEALAILDEEKLRQSAAAAKEELHRVAQTYALKGQLLVSKFQFDEAAKAYKAAIAVVPDDAEAHFNFARFCQDLNRFSEAESGFARALDLYRRAGDETSVSATLNNLGNLLSVQRRMKEAREAYDEALVILRKLVQQSTAALPDLAMTLNNLGVLLSEENQMEEARKAYDESLKIRRELARQDPATYLPDIAETLNNLGILHAYQRRRNEARKAFEEALEIYRRLAQQNPADYLPYVALTLSNLGVLYEEQHQPEKSRQAHEEALEISRKLARQNPAAYLPAVASTLNNLGNLYLDEHRMEDARKAYDEALEIRRKLAQQNAAVYLPDLATTLNNLGLLHANQGRLDEAREAFKEALEIFRKLAEQNPAVYRPAVAHTLDNLGDVHRLQNRIDEARKAFTEALEIYEPFAERDPEQYRPKVERTKELLQALEEKRRQ